MARQMSTQLTREAVHSIAFYAGCSSVMLVINKVTISRIPLPGFVFCVQFLTTFVAILVAKSLHLLRVDDLTWEKAVRFAPYVSSFVLAIYLNGKVLQHSNVETLITFRACSPLCVSLMDWAFLGRELPSRRSLVALVGVLAGAIGYVLCDSEFRLHGLGAYGWVSAYLVVIIFEMTYAKHMITNVRFDSAIWGSVLYTNALAAGPMLLLAIASGESRQLAAIRPEWSSMLVLVTCSVLGICMNWSGWYCRSQISAAAYTLLGVACKLISVLLNVMIWEKHATPWGIAALVVCLASSTLYRQAPLRNEAPLRKE